MVHNASAAAQAMKAPAAPILLSGSTSGIGTTKVAGAEVPWLSVALTV